MSKPFNRYHIPNLQLDSLLYGSYIKYDRLSDLIYNEFANKPEGECNHINLFIDLYSIMRSICFRQDFSVDPGMEYSLTSRTINMAAHYREYFRTRHNTSTSIYIISNFNMNDQYIYSVPEYRSKISLAEENGCREYLINNIKVLSILVPYLPGIYFKHYNTHNTSANILDIMEYNYENGNRDPNIIITKDIVTYQLVNYNKVLTVCIRPKKGVHQDIYGSNISEDVSYSINKSTLMQTYGMEKSNKAKNRDIMEQRLMKLQQINPELFSAFLSLVGTSEYNIPSIITFPTAVKDFYKIFVEDQFLLNQYNSDIGSLVDMINGISKKNPIDKQLVCARFNALDLYTNYQSFTYNGHVYKPVEDLYQPDMVKDINNRYFTSCPLDLNVL